MNPQQKSNQDQALKEFREFTNLAMAFREHNQMTEFRKVVGRYVFHMI
jgi:hypothetical protein